MHALSESALVNVCSIEARGPQHIGIHRGAEREMPPDANTQRPKLPGAIRPRRQVIERGPRVGVVACQLLRGLEYIASIRAGLIVRKHRSGSFKLVVNLRHRDDISVSRKERRSPPNGRGDLKYLGVEHDPWIASGSRGPRNVCPHRTVGSVECDKFVADDDHDFPPPSRCAFSSQTLRPSYAQIPRAPIPHAQTPQSLNR